MKKIYLVLLPLMAACGGNETTTSETTPSNSDTTTIDSAQTTSLTEGISEYERDWKNFVIAVTDKDEPAVISFMDTDAMTAGDLIAVCSENWVKDKLLVTTYAELTNTEFENKKVKEFRAEAEFKDPEGFTYESAIFLYFEEQVGTGLMLVGVLMAG